MHGSIPEWALFVLAHPIVFIASMVGVFLMVSALVVFLIIRIGR